jgi:hypothetical protein
VSNQRRKEERIFYLTAASLRMMMTMRTFMGSSRIKLCRVQSVVAAKEKCYSISTLLSPSGSIVPLKGTREQLDKRLPLTKIVATIGPASEHLPALSHVVDAGMRIMRINFSHATYDEADLRMRNLSACAVIDHTADAGQVHMRAVMLDTQGPEIRTGSFSSGTKEVLLKEGDLVSRCNIIHLLYAASTRCSPYILVDLTLQCMTVQRYCTIRYDACMHEEAACAWHLQKPAISPTATMLISMLNRRSYLRQR